VSFQKKSFQFGKDDYVFFQVDIECTNLDEKIV